MPTKVIEIKLPSMNIIALRSCFALLNKVFINLSLSPWYLLNTSDGRMEINLEPASCAAAYNVDIEI